MIRVGLTGGIGSGKSTVSQIFAAKGIPVFNSDNCAREAEEDQKIQEGFKRVLGDDIIVDGKVDRVKMRAILFTDKEKLKTITDLVTVYIKEQFERFVEKHKENNGFVLLESAILIEHNHHKNFDYIITVTASENTRIKRVMTRDKITVEEVLNKMNNQLPDMDKIKLSEFIVVNETTDISEGVILLEKQVNTIIKAITCDNIVKLMEHFNEAAKK